MAKTDIVQVFALGIASFLAAYFSDLGLLQKPFLVSLMMYLTLLFVIGAVVLRSFRWSFKATISAFVTISFLSLTHLLSFSAYDPIAPVSYFAILLLSFLINLFILYRRFIQDRPLFKIYEESKLAITFIVVSTIIAGLLIASQELMEQFGVLLMVGAALSYLVMLFFLAPFIRMEKHFQTLEKLSDHEKKVKHFIGRYGKKKELHPFYASWLGSAVSSIEDYIDDLEAKGHLGHNFFSAHNPFFAFFTVITFLTGVASARGSLALSLLPFLVLMTGIVFIAPQTFMKREVRRFSGVLLVIAGLFILYLLGPLPLKFGVYSLLASLISIYFAYTDDEIISMVFASFFVGSLFVLGYSLWKVPALLTPTPWVMTAIVFFLLVYEYYTNTIRQIS